MDNPFGGAVRRLHRLQIDDENDHDVHTVLSGDGVTRDDFQGTSHDRADRGERGEGFSMDITRYAGNGPIEARHLFQKNAAQANKSLSLQETELAMKSFERPPDERRQRSFRNGNPMDKDFPVDAAPFLRVGLKLLQGADKPQVARLEEQGMIKSRALDQKTAAWRFKTAHSLLTDFHVGSDLTFYETDRTSEIAQEARASRLQRSMAARAKRLPNDKSKVSQSSLIRDSDKDIVTIDSDCVTIEKDLRSGEWDIQSTLIEVDEDALVHLITNFRYLTSRTGPDMTFDETKLTLEKMIEDARRLFVRSPILFRMSTRPHIIHSKNTRYGIDHEDLFRTIYTSKGIKEIISLGAAYFNALDPSHSGDHTQDMIRPKFLQMVVLLLLLLNDDDLHEFGDFLESTYKLKADRSHLEMVFLKVVPLMSINPKVFLESLIRTVDNSNPFQKPETAQSEQVDVNVDVNMSHWWDVFIQQRLKEGYFLPSTLEDLGRDTRSWSVVWRTLERDGFKSSHIFNNLQYANPGCQLRAINDIAPIDLHPEYSLEVATVVLTDKTTFDLRPDDVEPITLLTPGNYAITESRQGGRTYDLIVHESIINERLVDAFNTVHTIIAYLNKRLEVPKERSLMSLRRISSKQHQPRYLEKYSCYGPISKNTASWGGATLASVYKIAGRKRSRQDVMTALHRDWNSLQNMVSEIERRAGEVLGGPNQSNEYGKLRTHLETVKSTITHTARVREGVRDAGDEADEPIAGTMYPNRWNPRARRVWLDYEAWYTENDRFLNIAARQSVVTRVFWQSSTLIEVSIQGEPSFFVVSPLHDVHDEERADEVRKDDIVVLAGEYMIIGSYANDGRPGYSMDNCLKIVSVESQTQTRRGANRSRAQGAHIVTPFR